MTESHQAKDLSSTEQRMREALHDIAFGAGIMLQPPLTPTSVLAKYAREVKRVAEEGLGHEVRI